jgi:uncharacterized protein (TIGR02646 family)
MIYVDKTVEPVPVVLGDKKGSGRRETDKVIKFYADSNNKDEPFTYRAYSENRVKDALGRVFHQKCAYCESRYVATQPVDVEHWRPKGGVLVVEEEKRLLKKPGYYWLAAEWNNLLPSCIDCNRSREQDTAQIDMRYGPNRSTSGKGTLFPIADESKRAMNNDGIPNEEPLLLHPCVDSPEEYLEFIEYGLVRAKLDESNKPKRKGEVSIDVYGLNRIGLVQGRREVLLLIQQRMFTILALIDQLEEKQSRRRRELIEDLLSYELDALSQFRDARRPYALMARQLIDAFINSLTT